MDPLGMADTGYDHHATVLPKRAVGYQHDLAGVINAPYLDMSLPFAAGALYSTVEDLHTWDQALYTDRLLPPELKQAMFTPGLEHYGFGWVIQTLPSGDPDAGKTTIAHGARINGFNTLEQRLPDRHLLVALLNNTPAANLDALAKGIRTILHGGTPEPPRRLLLNTLGPVILKDGADAAIAQYRRLKQQDRAAYVFDDASLNSLRYQLLGRDRPADAIVVFSLNAEEYPNSANVYDSLAEAYDKAGQIDRAIENYRKSVAIDPKNAHGQERLKPLETH